MELQARRRNASDTTRNPSIRRQAGGWYVPLIVVSSCLNGARFDVGFDVAYRLRFSRV
jgi:hypothetical protein